MPRGSLFTKRRRQGDTGRPPGRRRSPERTPPLTLANPRPTSGAPTTDPAAASENLWATQVDCGAGRPGDDLGARARTGEARPRGTSGRAGGDRSTTPRQRQPGRPKQRRRQGNQGDRRGDAGAPKGLPVTPRKAAANQQRAASENLRGTQANCGAGRPGVVWTTNAVAEEARRRGTSRRAGGATKRGGRQRQGGAPEAAAATGGPDASTRDAEHPTTKSPGVQEAVQQRPDRPLSRRQWAQCE